MRERRSRLRKKHRRTAAENFYIQCRRTVQYLIRYFVQKRRAGRRCRRRTIRRHKRAFSLIVSILCIAIFSGTLASAHEDRIFRNNDGNKQECYKSITVKYGDTLWDIAEEYMPEDYKNIQEYIYTLMALNNLSNDEIKAGQHLIIVYYNTISVT